MPEARIYMGTGSDMQLNALLQASSIEISECFERLGRFIPVIISDNEAHVDRSSGIDITLYLFRSGKFFSGILNINSSQKEYSSFTKKIYIRSRIPVNIPLLFAVHLAALHRGVPIYTRVIDKVREDVIIGAGQQSGIKNGLYNSSVGEIEVLQAGRHVSRVRINRAVSGKEIVIPLEPPVDLLIQEYNHRIESQAVDYFGGMRPGKGDPGKRFVEGMCIINPGANCCLPVYGGFLATDYQGFPSVTPDVPGLSYTGFLFLSEIMLVPGVTKFNGNFFPWEQDSDKNDSAMRLHYFSWGAIPFTLTAGYLDQLACQYQRSGKLPPFFDDRDEAAAFLSLLVPGTGHFYKGNRLLGWSYHTAQLGAGAYTVYKWDSFNSGERATAIASLVAIKLLDIFHAWAAKPGYDFFEHELHQSEISSTRFTPCIVPDGDKGVIFTLGCTRFF